MALACLSCNSTNIFFDYKTKTYRCLSCHLVWKQISAEAKRLFDDTKSKVYSEVKAICEAQGISPPKISDAVVIIHGRTGVVNPPEKEIVVSLSKIQQWIDETDDETLVMLRIAKVIFHELWHYKHSLELMKLGKYEAAEKRYRDDKEYFEQIEKMARDQATKWLAKFVRELP